MKNAKPILWIQLSDYASEDLQQKVRDSFPDYHVAITVYNSEYPNLQVLNGEALTDEKYNALMEALRK